MQFSTIKIARMGVVAGLYAVLSLVTFPIASGGVQFRLSEGLTLLPLIFPETALALFVGCVLSNLMTGCALFDVFIGAAITLVAGAFTAVIGYAIKNKIVKIIVGGLFPVILNAFLLPLIWWYCYGRLEYLYIVQALLLLASQALAVYLIGAPVYLAAVSAKEKGLKGFR